MRLESPTSTLSAEGRRIGGENHEHDCDRCGDQRY